jgi:sugar-specific transcriptional regulator TrmB
MIRELGFSEYEAKCYIALFERSSLSVNEVAKLSGIPRPSAYDVLEKMLAKGLVSITPGKTKRYSVSNPRLLKDVSINSLESELKELDRKREKIIKNKKIVLDNVDTIISELEPQYNENQDNGDPLEYIEILKNPNQIHRKFIELFSKAEKEVLAFTKPPIIFVSEEQRKEQTNAELAALDRNIFIRNIVQMPTDKLIEAYTQNGLIFPDKAIKGRERIQNSKFVDELPAKLFVFDERVCFFALEDPIKMKTSLTMLVAEHEAMAKSFKLLFETVWANANDYFVFDNKKYYMYKPEEEFKNKVNE